MKSFQEFLEAKEWNPKRLPLVLRGLAAEARKAPTFEDFSRDFIVSGVKPLPFRVGGCKSHSEK